MFLSHISGAHELPKAVRSVQLCNTSVAEVLIAMTIFGRAARLTETTPVRRPRLHERSHYGASVRVALRAYVVKKPTGLWNLTTDACNWKLDTPSPP